MNSLYFLVSVVLLFSASRGNEYDSNFGFMEYSNATNCNQTDDYFSYICANDSAFQICIKGEESTIVNCPSSAPKCHKGKCTAPTAQFKCPKVDGYYPDPSNCQKYHICAKGSDKARDCNPNYVYSPQTRSCVRKAGKPCYTIDCNKTSTHMVVYPGDKSIFALCDLATKTVLAIERCGEYFEMDAKEEKCKLVCSLGEGNYPDPKNTREYHECFLENNGVYNSTVERCPEDTVFDPTKRYCVTTA